MLCEACAQALNRLRRNPKARAVYDMEVDAFVWGDERVDLCEECVRDYRVVLNVRHQLWNGETPSSDFRMVYERFREICPAWIGFDREKPRQKPSGGRAAKDEFIDDD